MSHTLLFLWPTQLPHSGSHPSKPFVVAVHADAFCWSSALLGQFPPLIYSLTNSKLPGYNRDSGHELRDQPPWPAEFSSKFQGYGQWRAQERTLWKKTQIKTWHTHTADLPVQYCDGLRQYNHVSHAVTAVRMRCLSTKPSAPPSVMAKMHDIRPVLDQSAHRNMMFSLQTLKMCYLFLLLWLCVGRLHSRKWGDQNLKWYRRGKVHSRFMTVTAGLAMDCRAGLRWHFRCGCPISKPRPVLDFSPKNQGSFFFNFSEKSKNELVLPKKVFWWF